VAFASTAGKEGSASDVLQDCAGLPLVLVEREGH